MPDNELVKWRDDPRGPYIRLHSGRKFWLRDPTPEQFNIRDVAYHTAGVNRYTGGSRFSVAQHQVVGMMMAERFYPDEPLLPSRFLIHDGPEAMYGDMSSPLKAMNPEYKRLLSIAEYAWEQRCGLTFMEDRLTKEVDTRMWLTEREWIYRWSVEDIEEDYAGPLKPFMTLEGNYNELRDLFGPWNPVKAEEKWLEAFLERFPHVEW